MFKLLRTFDSVYRTRSFTKSAEELYFSQPTISKHVKWLEEMVGDELFERKGAGELIPTYAGHRLYDLADLLMAEWSRILEDIHSQQDNQPFFTLGVSHTFAALYLPPLVKHLMELNDRQIHFDIQVLNSSKVIEAINANEIDLGFIEKPIRTDMVNYHQLLEDELVLAGNLDSTIWLIREDHSGVRHYTEEYMQSRNIHERVMKINNNNTIMRFLHQGIGKSIISKHMTDGLDWAPLTGNFTRYFYFLEKENDPMGQAVVQQILDYFQTGQVEKHIGPIW